MIYVPEDKLKIIKEITGLFTKQAGINETLFDILEKKYVVKVNEGKLYVGIQKNKVWKWELYGNLSDFGAPDTPAIEKLKKCLCTEPYINRLINEYIKIIENSKEVHILQSYVSTLRSLRKMDSSISEKDLATAISWKFFSIDMDQYLLRKINEHGYPIDYN